jgi:hypothetical protein
MENVISNLLFDKDYKLAGIVDWEWSRVVPRQFMVPPIWLCSSQLDFVLLIQEDYNLQVGYLRAAVREAEKALGLPPRLSTEWEPLEKWYVPSSQLVTMSHTLTSPPLFAFPLPRRSQLLRCCD